eukprot:scaffold4746_cov248-Pinguiococcus_pyrenoidosus.AAC.1
MHSKVRGAAWAKRGKNCAAPTNQLTHDSRFRSLIPRSATRDSRFTSDFCHRAPQLSWTQSLPMHGGLEARCLA